jgi:Glycosyl hydrolase family 79 C-terminal beta domain
MWGLPAVGALLLLAGAVLVGVLLSNAGGRSARASKPAGLATADAAGSPVTGTISADPPARRPRRPDPPVLVSVSDRAGGKPIPSGFLGFSFEFSAVRTYTGTDPQQINPVLVQLIRNLTPGQAPVLRIGGDSTDDSYAPAPGVRAPAYVAYRLTPSWLATTAALAGQLGARMIMGLNLAADEPSLAAAEARAYLNAFGAGAIDALEIGNEPNVYPKVTVYHTVFGIPVPARPRKFGYPAFRRQFAAVAAATPNLRLAGPALAVGPTPAQGSFLQTMPSFLRGQPRVAIMTVHRYPLRNCYVPPNSPQYPTIAHLLSGYATAGLAASLKPWVAIAHAQHRLLRVDELNSVACRGKTGVSDTFASALWATDALFSLARVGVDGIDMHTLPDAAYELFQFSRSGGRWQGTVAPVYYGLQLFAQAAPAGSRLLALARHGADSGLSAWATWGRDHAIRVVLINKNQTHSRNVTIRVPAGSPSAATIERMVAPSVRSRGGVTLGGRTYAAATDTGLLATPLVSKLSAARRDVTLSVPHGSAALVTFGVPSAG